LLVLGLIPRLRFIGAFAAPVLLAVGIFALMPALDPPHGPKPEFRGALPSLHITMVLLAYGAFGLSCVAGIIYLTQDRNLKLNKARAILSLLPSIQRLERIIGEAMLIGFMLLTVGLALGAVFLHLNRDKLPVGPDPKIVWSAFVWLAYLALLIARWRFAPGGRRMALGAVGVFTFIMLTFWAPISSRRSTKAELPCRSSSLDSATTPRRSRCGNASQSIRRTCRYCFKTCAAAAGRTRR
jgi:ABC-type uncharacterized transport system permease subunit